MGMGFLMRSGLDLALTVSVCGGGGQQIPTYYGCLLMNGRYQCVLSGMAWTTSGAGTEMMEVETDRAQYK